MSSLTLKFSGLKLSFGIKFLEEQPSELRRVSKLEPWRAPQCQILDKKAQQQVNSLILKSSKNPKRAETPPSTVKEAHKYFDQAVLTVQSGAGGHGAILKFEKPAGSDVQRPQSKKLRALQKAKQKAERGGPKKDADGQILLPMGGHGGDVVLYADEFTDDLLAFHQKQRFAAKRGGNVNAAEGLGRRASDGMDGTSVRIPVPVGTVVKRKRGGKLMADLCQPGDEIIVARGGRGGISIVSSETGKSKLGPSRVPEGVSVIHSPEEKEMINGLPGEDVTLELTLRVVADVGLVGLPNAGKSSLLSAVTSARPQVAEYPFTTLMPNLGRLSMQEDRPGGPLGFREGEEQDATLADLPGLIRGAHLGKGLGRMFLRHLRRTRVLLHLVDASAEDPLEDYFCLREELWMYNEEYTERPHIVVLNKIDIPEAAEKVESLREALMTPSAEPKEKIEDGEVCREAKEQEDSSPTTEERGRKCPVAVVAISARENLGIEDLLKEVRELLRKDKSALLADPSDDRSGRKQMGFKYDTIRKPQWTV